LLSIWWSIGFFQKVVATFWSDALERDENRLNRRELSESEHLWFTVLTEREASTHG